MSTEREENNKCLPFNIQTHRKWENPKVSVIVPVYKVDKYLTQCLNSIVNQAMEELEIIIVDEGDHDRCREIIDYFEAHDPRIIAPHQKNGGYGASCNLGFSMAKGEYLAIVESDDWIEPEMYEEMYAYAKALDADVVKTPYYEYFSNEERRDCDYRMRLRQTIPQYKCFSMKEYGELLEVHASLWSGIYKREYLEANKIRFIEAKGGAYVDVGFRIDTLINSDRIAWLDKPFYNYRVDSIGSSTNTFKLLPMIHRWAEQHSKFAKDNENYAKYYGPHLIVDEYLNTVGWLNIIRATNEEYDLLHKTVSNINLEMIEKSPALNKAQKGDLLLFIKNPKKFKKRAAMKRQLRKWSDKTLRLLDKLADFNLLLWFFVMATLAFIAQIQINFNFTLEKELYKFLGMICGAFFSLGFLGCLICYLGKIFRKLWYKVNKLYQKKRKGGTI